MDKPLHSSKKRNEKFAVTDKNNRKTIISGTLIATFIGAIPYLFYLYEQVPTTQVWSNWLFTYDSKSWGDANYAMWTLTNKLIPFLLILIWFFTSRQWWYHVLIVPLTMYIYQIIGIFNDNLGAIDRFELVYLIPVMALVIPSIYLIRARMFNQMNDADKSIEELEEEFMIRPKSFWGKVKQYF